VDWFYNNLQERGDCQNTRKSHNTSHFVGWVVGWKNRGRGPCLLEEASRTRSFS